MSGVRHRTLRAGLLCVAWLAGSAFAGEDRAEVVLGAPATEAPLWTGQQLILNLDLKTPALSFAEVHFNLPEVSGALVLRTDTTTVKLTERRAGEAWQVLRYPITLFPQRAGAVQVPPFDVRFLTREGFDSAPVAHRLQTAPLSLQVRQPPGLEPGQVVVTTVRLELSSRWSLPSGDPQAGDAITLEVERQAAGLSAMLLPPLPVTTREGLAAYPADPTIDDRTNRGSLTGVRQDRITWIVERAGDYALPDIVFRSWNPTRERLETHRVAGVRFTAVAAPRATTITATDTANRGGPDVNPWRLLLAALLVTGAGFLCWRLRHRVGPAAAALRVRILPPARALLKTLNPGAPS